MLKISLPLYPVPVHNAYNGHLQKRTLGMVLWGVMLTSIILGIDNAMMRDWPAALLLFSLSLLCVFGLEANEHGSYLIVSSLTTLVILAVAFYTTLKGGGIHDPSIIVYPIIIFLGSLLFGKRAAPILFLACAGSLIFIGLLEFRGILVTPNSATIDDILVQVVLLAAEA